MDFRSICMLFLFLLLCPFYAAALEVAEGKISEEIKERVPVAAGDRFPASVGTLYCFTQITGAGHETSVTHVWRHDGEEMARIELPIGSSDWRTWSSKRIRPVWSGPWRVDVLGENGELLERLSFVIEED